MILHIVSLQVKRVPLLLENFLFLISQGIRSFASPRDNDVETLLVGPKFPLIFLPCNLNNTLQDQVSGLKFAYLHLLVVRCSDLLLVCYDVDLSLLPLFHD